MHRVFNEYGRMGNVMCTRFMNAIASEYRRAHGSDLFRSLLRPLAAPAAVSRAFSVPHEMIWLEVPPAETRWPDCYFIHGVVHLVGPQAWF